MRNPDKRRYRRQAKDAEKLEPKGKVAGTAGITSPVVNTRATGEKG